MSLRKGLALVMVAAFSLGNLLPAAAVTISSTNTTSSTLAAYVLPGNSTASNILTQNINATASSTEAAKNLTFSTLGSVANGSIANSSTLEVVVAAAGQKLYTDIQPAFTGSNQTQNWNVVVCETAAAGFTNGQDFFIALPSGWDLNLENGGATSLAADIPKIFTTAVSNGITLASAVASDAQEKSSTLRAGVAVHISDNGTQAANASNRDCFSVNLQHENIIAPAASSTAATIGVYTFTNGASADNAVSTVGNIALAGTTSTTDLPFAPSILDSSVTVSIANGNDLTSSFLRTGAAKATGTDDLTSQTQAENIADGAIQQTQLGTQSSVLRYRASTSDSKIPGLVLTESHAGAWNLLNGETDIRPAKTLPGNGGVAFTANADTLADDGSWIVLNCESNGASLHLVANGTPVVTPLGSDLDIDVSDTAVTSGGQLLINIGKRTGSLVDPNTVASRLVVTGLAFNGGLIGTATPSAGTIECRAHARRESFLGTDNGNGALFEALADAEAVTSTADTTAGNKFLALYTANGDVDNTVYYKWAESQGVAGSQIAFNSNGSNANNGNSAYFSAYTGTTIGSASVLNATTALKTLKTATQYGVTVASLPSASTVSGDADKLVTITIAENSLTPGLPVEAVGSITSDGAADTVTALASANGSVKLALRSKAGSTITLTAPTLNTTNGNGTLAITATAATITPSFTSTAITSELDGADGFVQRGSKALLVFTVTTANTIGFTFSDEVANANINGAEVVRFGTTDKYAALVSPGAGAFTLTVDVDGTEVTKALTIGTAFTAITTTSFPPNGAITLSDKRATKGTILFKAARNKFLDSTRVFEVSDLGVVTEANVTLKNKKTVASIEGGDDTEYVCITSARQTNCFDI